MAKIIVIIINQSILLKKGATLSHSISLSSVNINFSFFFGDCSGLFSKVFSSSLAGSSFSSLLVGPSFSSFFLASSSSCSFCYAANAASSTLLAA